MARHVGLETRSAREQLQVPYPSVGVQPLLQAYKPGRATPGEAGIVDPGDPLSFFVLGDVGGVKAPGPQNEHVDRLTQELQAADGNKPVIVALHHPPYSVAAHHGGSPEHGRCARPSVQHIKSGT